jgi:hypothetical protein
VMRSKLHLVQCTVYDRCKCLRNLSKSLVIFVQQEIIKKEEGADSEKERRGGGEFYLTALGIAKITCC